MSRLAAYAVGVMRPEPLVISWQGRQVRVRHNDPRLTPYSPKASVIRSAAELVIDVDGLRLALDSAVGARYVVWVSDDGTTVGLWQRAC